MGQPNTTGTRDATKNPPYFAKNLSPSHLITAAKAYPTKAHPNPWAKRNAREARKEGQEAAVSAR
jgi:hypothetical protein